MNLKRNYVMVAVTALLIVSVLLVSEAIAQKVLPFYGHDATPSKIVESGDNYRITITEDGSTISQEEIEQIIKLMYEYLNVSDSNPFTGEMHIKAGSRAGVVIFSPPFDGVEINYLKRKYIRQWRRYWWEHRDEKLPYLFDGNEYNLSIIAGGHYNPAMNHPVVVKGKIKLLKEEIDGITWEVRKYTKFKTDGYPADIITIIVKSRKQVEVFTDSYNGLVLYFYSRYGWTVEDRKWIKYKNPPTLMDTINML